MFWLLTATLNNNLFPISQWFQVSSGVQSIPQWFQFQFYGILLHLLFPIADDDLPDNRISGLRLLWLHDSHQSIRWAGRWYPDWSSHIGDCLFVWHLCGWHVSAVDKGKYLHILIIIFNRKGHTLRSAITTHRCQFHKHYVSGIGDCDSLQRHIRSHNWILKKPIIAISDSCHLPFLRIGQCGQSPSRVCQWILEKSNSAKSGRQRCLSSRLIPI